MHEVAAFEDGRVLAHRFGSLIPASRSSVSASIPQAHFAQAVGHQVEAEDQAGDRQGRDQQHVGELPDQRDFGRASLIIRPQSGSGGCRPRPRKVSVVMATVV